MKLIRTEITPLTNEFSSIELRDQQFLQSPYYTRPVFHEHPEYELVYIMEGFGKRIIGETTEAFEAGDMVFIGANVPHVWLSDEAFYNDDSTLHSKAVITYFNPEKFKDAFENVDEFSNISKMLQLASRGIRIFGNTRQKIATLLEDLVNKKGFERLHGILHIMHLIAESNDVSYVNKNEVYTHKAFQCDRLIEVMNYIKENLHNPITLKEVSQVAFMTQQSFCRFFRNRTRKSFSQYLIEQRIAYACNLLLQTNKSISEIAYLCGYLSSSHFCKVFKGQVKQSPYQYKRSVLRIAV